MNTNVFKLTVLICFISVVAKAQKKIEVPYFGTMTPVELCGLPACKPTISPYWAMVNGGKFYDGVPGNILGRSFKKSVFETNSCVFKVPIDNDVNVFATHNLSGKVQENKKKDFDATINANLTRLINSQNLPDSIKANLLAQIKNSVESATSKNIELIYKVVELKQPYIDEQVNACYAHLERKHKIVTGVSLISLKGNWTSNTLSDAFKKFEINAALFKSLSAEIKANYEKTKETLLNGNFEPFSLVLVTSYKYKG